jgi:hypothetical protein
MGGMQAFRAIKATKHTLPNTSSETWAPAKWRMHKPPFEHDVQTSLYWLHHNINHQPKKT